jgi:hypothetical protein
MGPPTVQRERLELSDTSHITVGDRQAVTAMMIAAMMITSFAGTGERPATTARLLHLRSEAQSSPPLSVIVRDFSEHGGRPGGDRIGRSIGSTAACKGSGYSPLRCNRLRRCCQIPGWSAAKNTAARTFRTCSPSPRNRSRIGSRLLWAARASRTPAATQRRAGALDIAPRARRPSEPVRSGRHHGRLPCSHSKP